MDGIYMQGALGQIIGQTQETLKGKWRKDSKQQKNLRRGLTRDIYGLRRVEGEERE